MLVLASTSHTDSVSAATVLAAPTSIKHIRRCRVSVTGSMRVQIKVGSDTNFIDNDFDDGGGVSEDYREGIAVPVGSAVTVTTTGTGTTRVTLLGE